MGKRTGLVVAWCALVLLLGCGEDEHGKTEGSLGQDTQRLVAPTQINTFAVLASGRATFRDRTQLTGGNVGAFATTGDAVTAGADARFAIGKATLGSRVVLKERAIAGDLFANTVSAPLATYATLSPFSTPPALPPIVSFTAGTTPITVNSPTTLAAGNAGTVTVNSTLTLSGGTYQWQNVVLGNNAVVQANAATIVRIAGRITGTTSNHVRLVVTGTQPAGNLRFIVAGANDTTGGVFLGTDAEIKALILSRAAFSAADRLVATGAIAASNVTAGNDSRLTFATGFECNVDSACNDNNPCTTDSCIDAKCVHPAVPNGTACPDDGNFCTSDACSSGVCAHPALANGTACPDDTNPCTSDACMAGQCAHPAVANGTTCPDDTNLCTSDACLAGQCAHPAVANDTPCPNEGNDCTLDRCAAGVCAHPAVPDGTNCVSDGKECTADQCIVGVCSHPNLPNGSPCREDGNECTGDTCGDGNCTHPPVPDGSNCVNDSNPCTTDNCGAGTCRHDLLANVGHCGSADAVTPIFICVTEGVGGRHRALFGYDNPTGETVYATVGTGNDFQPSPGARGQPEQFAPGYFDSVFAVNFFGSSVTWFLGGNSAVATISGPACSAEACSPGCAASEQCVNGTCVGSCGDSLCGPENCTTCPFDCGCDEAPKIALVDRPTEMSAEALAALVPDVTTAAFSSLPGPVYGGSTVQASAIMTSATDADEGAPIAFNVLGAATGPFTFQVTALNYSGDEGLCGSVNPFIKNLTIDGVNFGGASQGTVQVPRDQSTVTVTLEVWDSDGGLCLGDDKLANFSVPVDNYNPTDTCTSAGDGSVCWKSTPIQSPSVCFNWNAQFIDGGPWGGVGSEDFLASKAVQSSPASFARMDATLKRNTTDGPQQIVYQFGGFLDEKGCIPLAAAPNREDWAPGAGIFGTFKLASQLCLDPTGFDCLPDVSTTPPTTTGANALILPGGIPGGATGPGVICSVLTEDATLVTDPSCAANVHPITWTVTPPNPIVPPNVEENATTRAAAVMSHIFAREVQTNGGLGVQNALIDRRLEGNATVTIKVNTFCCVDNAGNGFDCSNPRVTKMTSCRDRGVLLLEPDGMAISGTRLKYVVAHEVGHFIQGNAQGLMAQDYNGPGLGGRGPLCDCTVVPVAENLHCLQSLEEPNAAQIEGFGQYFASKVWNDDSQADCTFVYYKNLGDTACRPGVTDCALDPGGSGLMTNKPPVPVSCVEQARWRNQKCLGTTPSAALLESGTEFDWLEFLYGVGKNAVPAARWNMQDLFDAYVVACGNNDPAAAAPCTSRLVSWAGGTGAFSLRDGASALKGPASAAALAFQAAGNTFGISNTP